jgi:hypothetical protein
VSDEKKSAGWLGAILKKQKEILVFFVFSLAMGYPITIRGVMEKMSDQTGGVPVLRAEFDEHVTEAQDYSAQVDKVLNIVIKDGIRIIDKLADRVVSDPDAVREGDMAHIIDTIWPAIPDELKTGTLTAHYQLIVDHYNQSINGAG